MDQKQPLKSIANGLACRMPSAQPRHNNPVETLSIDDIVYLQKYLETIKQKKQQYLQNQQAKHFPVNRVNEIYDPLNRGVPVDWRTPQSSNTSAIVRQNIEPGPRGTVSTRSGKRSQQNLGLDNVNTYYNPYECGSKQDTLPPVYKPVYRGSYDNDPVLLNQMGVQSRCAPSHIRDVNVESALMQKEMTHIPGQKEVGEREVDRFNLLPFDPQDHRHIIWADNMPRGGYATRTERLDL